MLGDTGANHPANWVGGLASADLHAIATAIWTYATFTARKMGSNFAQTILAPIALA
jgi:hypothetical protein